MTSITIGSNEENSVNSENTLNKRKNRLDNDVPQLLELKNLPIGVRVRLKPKTISVVLSYEILLALDIYIKFSEFLAPSYSGHIHYGSIIDGMISNQLKNDENFKKYCKENYPEAVEFIFK